MKTKKLKSLLAVIRSMGLALIIFVVATWIIIGFFVDMLGEKIKYGHPDNWLSQYYDIIVFILYILIIVIACFYIVRQNPKSIWSVPLICNAYSIAVAITEPTSFWKDSYGIIFCFGWVLSITASLIGARIGKSNAISDNH
jgi:uncharacterized BrkB/YihY/UPF0761 family membrane protein